MPDGMEPIVFENKDYKNIYTPENFVYDKEVVIKNRNLVSGVIFRFSRNSGSEIITAPMIYQDCIYYTSHKYIPLTINSIQENDNG